MPSTGHWPRNRGVYLAAKATVALLYGGFWGMRFDTPLRYQSVFGIGGNDDVERSVRHTIYLGGIALLARLIARKRMYQAGGCQAVAGSKVRRVRLTIADRRKLLAWALGRLEGRVQEQSMISVVR